MCKITFPLTCNNHQLVNFCLDLVINYALSSCRSPLRQRSRHFVFGREPEQHQQDLDRRCRQVRHRLQQGRRAGRLKSYFKFRFLFYLYQIETLQNYKDEVSRIRH